MVKYPLMIRSRARLAAVLACLLAARARAQSPDVGGEIIPPRALPPGVETSTSSETPPYLRWMLEPRKNGMFVRLPIVDTDPNRGTTFGILPILVIQDPHTDRITQIHAPSLTYNADFKLEPTYRYYYYPTAESSLAARASWGKYEREVMSEYSDRGALGTPYDVFLRFQYNVDAGQRFYGLGPDSAKNDEANYQQQYWQYKLGIGTPLAEGSHWRAHISARYESSRILDGPLQGLPGFNSEFPAEFSDRYQQTNETRATLDYDTRDSLMTTTSGALFQVYSEASIKGFLSEYDYERYGADARWFHPWASNPSRVFAMQYQYEQIVGPTPPFWVLPMLGGKYSSRAYGDGRFVDRGATSFNIEQRFTLLEEKMAGVTTEFQLAPFAGVGTVFDAPGSAQFAYLRPVAGAAVRAVAKPQVVGSVDVGYGQEGVAVFMDINYSF
jgi:hypothetical protein